MSWTGGIFGTIYIAVSIFLLPRHGAATVIGLIVAGQMMGSLAFDHFGLFGLEVHSVSPVRAIGAVLLVAGVVLVRFNPSSDLYDAERLAFVSATSSYSRKRQRC